MSTNDRTAEAGYHARVMRAAAGTARHAAPARPTYRAGGLGRRRGQADLQDVPDDHRRPALAPGRLHRAARRHAERRPRPDVCARPPTTGSRPRAPGSCATDPATPYKPSAIRGYDRSCALHVLDSDTSACASCRCRSSSGSWTGSPRTGSPPRRSRRRSRRSARSTARPPARRRALQPGRGDLASRPSIAARPGSRPPSRSRR